MCNKDIFSYSHRVLTICLISKWGKFVNIFEFFDLPHLHMVNIHNIFLPKLIPGTYYLPPENFELYFFNMGHSFILSFTPSSHSNLDAKVFSHWIQPISLAYLCHHHLIVYARSIPRPHQKQFLSLKRLWMWHHPSLQVETMQMHWRQQSRWIHWSRQILHWFR